MNTSYPKKYKCIAYEIEGTVPYTSKRSRVKTVSTLVHKYKYTQTLLLYNGKSKLRYPTKKIDNTNPLLDHNSSFRQVFSPKELVLPTTQVEHIKNLLKVAEVVKDTEEKSKDKKRKAHFSQGTDLAISFKEKRAEYFQNNLIEGKSIA